MGRHRGDQGVIRGDLHRECEEDEDRRMATMRRGDHTGHWPHAAHHQDMLRLRDRKTHVLK